MNRSRVVLLSLIFLVALLALPAMARAEETPDGWTWDETAVVAEPASDVEPVPEGWTWDETAAPAEPTPDGWTWDEAAAPPAGG